MFTLDGNVKFINIDANYIKKLNLACSEVYYKSVGYDNKPYIGILINEVNRSYVIPLSSAKEKHKSWKNVNQECYLVYEYTLKSKMGDADIWVEDAEESMVKHIMSVIDIKKMIPIKPGVYKEVNMNKDNTDTPEVAKYKDLINKEYENGELLQHCGPWPLSCASCRPTISYPLAFDYPGAVEAQAKQGTMTLCRFDGDNGEYSLLLGNAKGVDGPYTKGTYVWVEVANLKRLEAKLVEGPYIHHCVGIHKDVVPVLYEACKYIGVKPDLYDPVEEDVKAYLRGE